MANAGSGIRWLSGVTHVVLNKALKGLQCTKMAQDVLGHNPKQKQFPNVAQGGLDLCLSPRTHCDSHSRRFEHVCKARSFDLVSTLALS